MSAPKKLTKEEVLHLAKLANLTLNEEEIALYQAQLSDIIGYVEKLNSVDTNNVEPVEQLTELTNVNREDTSSDKLSLSQTQALQNTKSTKDGYIRVEAIFDE